MAFRYAVPSNTDRHTNRVARCGNLGLVLDKYQPWDFVLSDSNKKAGQTKSEWYKALTAVNNQENLLDAQLLGRLRHRWEALTDDAQTFRLWSATPLLVGLGGGGTLETGLTLHPLYGFPYIPATSLKGVARARIFYALAGQLGVPGLTNEQMIEYKDKKTPLQLLDQLLETELDGESDAWRKSYQQLQAHDLVQAEAGLVATISPQQLREILAESAFQAVFGTLGQGGGVSFFDAIPVALPTITMDIMNPHYADYYGQEDEAPHEGHARLNPVTYLAVQSGTPFCFAVGVRQGATEALAQKAAKWLRSGLINLGIGAKTSSGYGVMSGRQPRDVTQRKHRRYFDRGG